LATELHWQSLYNRLRDHGQKGLAIEALSAADDLKDIGALPLSATGASSSPQLRLRHRPQFACRAVLDHVGAGKAAVHQNQLFAL
jgi:hypothetical protein